MIRHPTRHARIAARSAALLAAAMLAVSACNGSGPMSRPSPSATVPTAAPTAASIPTPGAATPPAPTRVPGSDDHTPPPSPGTFKTAWGEAWDTLPPGFPVPANANPADPGDPAEGPVSGAFVVGDSPDEVVRQVQVGLAAAGYSTEALSGPFEDGSLVIDSVGTDPECRVQTRVRGLGGTTMVTVLYGAACPWG